MGAIAIYSSGMVTGVGWNSPASCAAMRVGIAGFVETSFEFAGEALLGSPVTLADDPQGIEKLRQMVVPTITECLADEALPDLTQLPLLLCLAEEKRVGRFEGLDTELLRAIAEDLGCELHPESRLYASGHLGGVRALKRARQLITGGVPGCLIAGVDTYLVAETLTAFDADGRLMTAENTNGFIPGEAAAAILVGPVRRQDEPQLMCLGIGFGVEPAPLDSGEPLRAEGLTTAIKAAFADGRCQEADVDFRLTDNNGEAYGFKDSALAVARVFRDPKEEFDIWHPADCIGEVGAAIVPLMLGVMQTAATKGYAPGAGVLCHVSGESEQRGALILRHRNWSDD